MIYSYVPSLLHKLITEEDIVWPSRASFSVMLAADQQDDLLYFFQFLKAQIYINTLVISFHICSYDTQTVQTWFFKLMNGFSFIIIFIRNFKAKNIFFKFVSLPIYSSLLMSIILSLIY